MRHRKSGVKLNRTTSHRQAMFRNMVTSLFKYDKIKTTAPKAKELRRWADHIITLAKRGDLHARRQAMSIVREKDVVHKLFEEAAERFGARTGGYTRIVKVGPRSGDAAPLTVIELLGALDQKPGKTKKTATRTEKQSVAVETAPETKHDQPAESAMPSDQTEVSAEGQAKAQGAQEDAQDETDAQDGAVEDLQAASAGADKADVQAEEPQETKETEK